MAEVRTANVTWNGDLHERLGMIDYVSSGVFSRMPVSWAARTGPHNGKTSPEELLAAAHGVVLLDGLLGAPGEERHAGHEARR